MIYREVARKLRRLGCQELPRRGGGSHRKWYNSTTHQGTTIPDWGPTRTVHITWPTIRGFSHTFHAGVDFRREGSGGDWTPLCVPLHSGFNLGSRRRMKSNPDVRHQYAS
jgi:predicted RNA binding protein YcfA (HicA-like mRNA interferase family)